MALLSALGHPQRLRILAQLGPGRAHVSDLARQLGISRPLLYMHLDRLEKAGLVRGELELADDGKSRKYFSVVPFDVRLDVATVNAVLAKPGAASEPSAPATKESPT